MAAKTTLITATISYNLESVRIAIPVEQHLEPTAGHREIDTGVIRIGHHTGKRWGVVHNYSIWTRRDGTVRGDMYIAYDLNIQQCRDDYAVVLATAHYTDTETGRSIDATDLLEGACNREATADEIDLLERNGYSHDDAEDAHVVAQRDGATLYHMRHAGYAIEGETGEMLGDLDAESAIRNWRRS